MPMTHLTQARNSLAREVDCHHFDVCFNPEDDANVFLYENYSNGNAFDAHLASAHFAIFERRTSDWILQITVRAWQLHTAKTTR